MAESLVQAGSSVDGEQRVASGDGTMVRSAPQEPAWDSFPDRLSITLRPVASPVSLGLFGLAAATLVMSGLQLGWVEPSEGRTASFVLMGFAFVAQLLASLVAMSARDGVVATAMGVLSLTWLVFGLTLFTSTPGSTSDALGLFLVFSGAAMVLTALTASMGKVVPALVFATAGLRFLFTAVYEFSASGAWKRVSGIVGLILFALAMYTAWAAQLEDATGKTVLPIGRRNTGAVALEGSLLEQTGRIRNEPGVRRML